MTKPHTYVLGINAYEHDVSACLLRDGEIVCAIEKERLTRLKHDRGFYEIAVTYCLEMAGISLADIDHIIRNCYVLPVEEMEERLVHQYAGRYLGQIEYENARKSALFLSKASNVVTISHHVAHAYSAFAPCPFEEGAVMVVDGVGSYKADVLAQHLTVSDTGVHPLARESESYYTFKGTTIEPLKKVWLQPARGFLSDEFYNMAGLGALYSRVSLYIFGDWNKCGEVMALAPYGRPERIKSLMYLDNGELVVPDWTAEFDKPRNKERNGSWEDSPNLQHWKDLAWRVQDDAEKVLLARARWLREKTGAKNLCISGGVALNCVAIGRLVREAGFENVWIQPAAGDDGIAIGCAYYGHLVLQKKARSTMMEHAYFGREYTAEDIEIAASRVIVRMETKRSKCENMGRDAAALLAKRHILGWFQGRSEFGPRALGNRSILADPRTPEMKDIVNKRVKFRQAFRPFAPVVRVERAHEIFVGEGESPYMLVARDVRPDWRNKIPAVTHVDGTARVQTVRRETNEKLYLLLVEFEKLTGIPVLLNTSFNIRGEPMVETPEDAIRCFLSTGIDYLALDDLLMTKTALHKIISPFAKAYALVATVLARVRAGSIFRLPQNGSTSRCRRTSMRTQ